MLAAPVAAADSPCGADHFVASWAAAPTDSVTPMDSLGAPVPLGLNDQTLRMVIAPHRGGGQSRVHLSNRFGTTPVTFGRVTLGRQSAGPAVGDIGNVTFGGAPSVTLAPGTDLVSDPLSLPFAAFEPLVVSMHVAGPTGPPTKHWNANATSYYAPPGSGDLTGQPGGAGFSATTGSWLSVSGLDVLAGPQTRSVVAFGDSITDGFVAAGGFSVPSAGSVVDVNGRYPDDLQRRIDAAGMPISVVNAGIGSNRLRSSGEPLLMGPSGIQRFQRDALDQPGVGGVVLMEGINDLGFPPAASADEMIAAHRRIIADTHAAGRRIWLGTITPAANSLVDGIATAPNSETSRRRINDWIRTQTEADGVIDFDAAVRDPGNPSVLNPEYSGPDHLHPNLAGYRAMADAVDLDLLGSVTPRC